VPWVGFRLATVSAVAVHADLLETGGRNGAVRALIGLRAGAERVGGSVCAADVAEWRKRDTSSMALGLPPPVSLSCPSAVTYAVCGGTAGVSQPTAGNSLLGRGIAIIGHGSDPLNARGGRGTLRG
jgi:hypothetical protein